MTRDEILNMPAGREMDALVAIKLMGGFTVHGDNPWSGPKPYSTDIAAAWEVVEHFTGKDCRNGDFFIECWTDGEWFVAFGPGYPHRNPMARCDGRKTGHPSAPLAICRAALLAVLEAE